jgi:hypothetical protein
LRSACLACINRVVNHIQKIMKACLHTHT